MITTRQTLQKIVSNNIHVDEKKIHQDCNELRQHHKYMRINRGHGFHLYLTAHVLNHDIKSLKHDKVTLKKYMLHNI